MQLGIFAKTFSAKDTLSIFEQVRATGIDCVHYNMACSGLPELPLEIPEETVDEVHRCSRKTSINVVGLSATYNMIHPDPRVREKGLRSLDCLARACKRIGTNFVSLCTGSRDANDKWKRHPDNCTPKAWEDLQASMEKALLIADEHDILLGVEPEIANVVSSAALARKLLDEMQSKRLKIILDPANLFESVEHSGQINALIDQALQLLGDEIATAHAKDRTLGGTFKAAGQGNVDFPYFVDKLGQAGFNGPLILHGLDEMQVAASAGLLKPLIQRSQ